MFCTTIIPTVGRATLSRAVHSVLNQNLTAANFELIVVNDSGTPLPPANWQQSERTQVINTKQRERCIARNAGAAIAQGKYLHFLDDDDWLLPNALHSFWQLDRALEAVWLYGSSQLVDRTEQPIIQLHHNLQGNCLTQVIAGEWVPLQASLIRADTFFAVGGFHPLIPGAEDIDIARQIALKGNIYGTNTLVASIGMGEENSTTNYRRAMLDSRWAREKILNQAKVFQRMIESAKGAYWHGRVARAYLTSMVWNIQHKRVFTAVSRSFMGIASLILSGPYIFTSSFWHAVSHQHESQTFIKGFQAANRPIERRGERSKKISKHIPID